MNLSVSEESVFMGHPTVYIHFKTNNLLLTFSVKNSQNGLEKHVASNATFKKFHQKIGI